MLRFHWATAGPGGAPGRGFMQLDDATSRNGLALGRASGEEGVSILTSVPVQLEAS